METHLFHFPTNSNFGVTSEDHVGSGRPYSVMRHHAWSPATPQADTEATIINNNSPKINFLTIILTSKTFDTCNSKYLA